MARSARVSAIWRTPNLPCWASESPSQAPSPRDRFAHRCGPASEIDAVGGEQRQRQPVEPERDAAGVGHLAGRGADVPGRAEMIAVIIEAHACGRLLGRMHRDQELEFERLLDL